MPRKISAERERSGGTHTSEGACRARAGHAGGLDAIIAWSSAYMQLAARWMALPLPGGHDDAPGFSARRSMHRQEVDRARAR